MSSRSIILFAISAACCAWGCGRTCSTPPGTGSLADSGAPDGIASFVASGASAIPVALDADTERADPEPLRWLRAVQTEKAPIAFNRRRGVVLATYYEDISGENPEADSEGVVKGAVLMCTDSAVLAQVRIAFSLGFPITCSTHACTFHAMEGTPAVHVELRRVDAGFEVVRITRVDDEHTVAESWRRQALAWTARHASDLERRTCP